jgi:hypothetical protein
VHGLISWHWRRLESTATDLDEVSLHIAALFHDSGTADIYNGTARFEVEGADAAARFLQERDWSADRVDVIWDAIALHTTAGIPERRAPRRGDRLRAPTLRGQFSAVITDIETRHPRGRVEVVLGGSVVAQALADPRKAPRPSWAADLVAHHRPGDTGINPAF